MNLIRKLIMPLLLMLVLVGTIFFAWSTRSTQSPEIQICQNAIKDFNENYQTPSVEFRHTIGHRTLFILRCAGNAHAYGWDNLIVGVWDERFHYPVGKSLALLGDGGQWQLDQNTSNQISITLYNGQLFFSEYYSSGSYHLTFDGKKLALSSAE